MDFRTSLPPLSKEDIFAYSINKHRAEESIQLSTMLTEVGKFEFYSTNAYSNSNFAYYIQLATKSRKWLCKVSRNEQNSCSVSCKRDGAGIFLFRNGQQLNIGIHGKLVNDYSN